MNATGRGLLVALVLATSAAAADQVRRERIELSGGAGTTEVEGRLKGFESVEYQVPASAGQQLTIALASENPATYYNLFAPGDVPGESTAVYVAARDGLEYHGTVAATGDYTVQVFLIRAAARRAEESAYTLSVGLAGEAAPAAEGDALVPGTRFQATGELRCAVGAGQPMVACRFGVEREGGGTATIHLRQPGGGERTIRFEAGRAVGAAPAGGVFAAMRQGDDTIVSIDDERYEIPDVVPHGD
ncbi:MAG TPA: hypothetical protein VM891_02520 [Amaricoccus sp.]|nr:hypothetical protein [Amaricoccus sp.]